MTFKRGFEVYYFDGKGSKPVGPLDFGEFMGILGDMDDGIASGSPAPEDVEQYELFPTEAEALSNRKPEESSDTGTSQTIKE